MFNNLWESRGFQLLFGIVGIYTCYWISGVLQQKISKRPYEITNTVEWDTFESPVALLYIPCSVAWLFGFIVNNFFSTEHTKMPATNLIACAIMVCISTHTYMVAIYLTNFPIVMLVKSCNIVSVVLVGVFCSRVRDKSLALGPKKIVIACLISSGIILYNFGGDQKHKQKATDPLGVFLLLISLVADGFLPDFQASIKSQFHPRPMQMFEHINKWVTILSFIYAVISGQFKMAIQFNSRHPQLGIDFFILSILTTIGQVFVYRMIKQFKQHIVPFVITTRKIFTVVISIIFYGHETSFMQYLAIALIFCTASYEYLSQIYGGSSQKHNEHHPPQIKPVIHSGSTTMLQQQLQPNEQFPKSPAAKKQINLMQAQIGQEIIQQNQEGHSIFEIKSQTLPNAIDLNIPHDYKLPTLNSPHDFKDGLLNVKFEAVPMQISKQTQASVVENKEEAQEEEQEEEKEQEKEEDAGK